MNYWDNGEQGNYWSDYIGSDNDSDGIGDAPYNILGGNNKDNYPLVEAIGIDKVNPKITIINVSDNAYYNTNVTPVIKIFDINLNTSAITLNGEPFVSGTTIANEGNYTLCVVANDKAGNAAQVTLNFVIDKTPPTIFIANITNDTHNNTNITIEIDFFDLHLNTTLIELNNKSYLNAILISNEGNYTLKVYASDKAGNFKYQYISFAIDKTPPHIKINYPKNNTITNENVVLNYTLSDNIVSNKEIAVNIPCGTVYSEEGIYTVAITATDRAGNTASEILHFCIDKTAPTIFELSPKGWLKTDLEELVIYGRTESNVSVTLNGEPLFVNESGVFVKKIALKQGENLIKLKLNDSAGNVYEETITIIREIPNKTQLVFIIFTTISIIVIILFAYLYKKLRK
jgi:hypothetical protein